MNVMQQCFSVFLFSAPCCDWKQLAWMILNYCTVFNAEKKILKDCEATIYCNKHYKCSSSRSCRPSYLSAAGQAVSWLQCPAMLQPGSWADFQYCWLPAGGSAGSVGADTTLGITVRQNHLYGDLWRPFAHRLIIYD